MPVYNVEKYLKEAIDSILNQTYKNIELIIIDDCSTDSSRDIIKSYSDSRIKTYYNSENMQQPRTRNRGLELAKGDYIANMDSDDISFLNRIEEQVVFMEKNKDIDICGCYCKTFGGVKKRIVKTPLTNEDCKMVSIVTSPIAHPTVMIRSSSLKKYDIKYDLNYKYSQDFELWSRLLFQGANFSNIPEVLLNYRENPTGVTYGHSNESQKYTEKVIVRNLSLLFGDNNHFDDIFNCTTDINCFKKSITVLTELKKKNNKLNLNEKQIEYIINYLIIYIANKYKKYDLDFIRVLVSQININKSNMFGLAKLLVKSLLYYLRIKSDE